RKQLGRDLIPVDSRQFRIRQRKENDVGTSNRFRCFKNFQSVTARNRTRFASRIKTDYDPNSAVTQVQRVSVALRAKADYGAGFRFQPSKIDIFIGVNAHSYTSPKRAAIANESGR